MLSSINQKNFYKLRNCFCVSVFLISEIKWKRLTCFANKLMNVKDFTLQIIKPFFVKMKKHKLQKTKLEYEHSIERQL